MIIARVVSGVKDHFILRFQEWVATFMLMQGGITLLRPGETFSSSPGYTVMQAMANEETWGVLLVAVSALRFIALLLNGTFKRFRRASPYVRSVTAGLSAFTWGLIALGVLSANTLSFGGSTYTGLFVSDLIIAILVAGEAGAAEKAYHDANARSQP